MSFSFGNPFPSHNGGGRRLRSGAYAAVVISAGLLAVGGIGAASASRSVPQPLATKYSGSAAGALLEATNTGTKANDTYGVEGVVTKASGGAGVYGYGNSKTLRTYGLYGKALGPNSFGGLAEAVYPASGTKSSTPNPSSESMGLQGVSSNANGVQGLTKYPDSSDGFSIGGVVGIDESTSSLSGSNNNSGVLGVTNYGSYGVTGEGGSNAIGGVLGEGSLYGVYGYGYSVGSAATASGKLPSGGGNGLDFMGTDPTGKYIDFSVDNQGNLYFSGSVSSVVKSQNGASARTYLPRSSEPVMEDYGQGQLRDGSAYVRLDPTFGSTMDARSSYLVYVTPDGENHGIYVTGKSARGFWVRESYGGHSSVAFDYRVVAIPSGESGKRMELVAPQTVSSIGRNLARPSSAMASQMSEIRSGRAYSPALVLDSGNGGATP